MSCNVSFLVFSFSLKHLILTPHILVGAAIASQISNPVLGIIFAFFSHYEINFPALREFFFAFSDIATGLTLVYLLTLVGTHNQFAILAGGFAAALPDSIHASSYVFPPRIVKILNIGHTLHSKYKNPPIFLGVLTQIGIILIAAFVLLV